MRNAAGVIVRKTRGDDFERIIEISKLVYPHSPPWHIEQLESHLNVFPDGQFVAVDAESDRVLGMAASLIIRWDDYQLHADWRYFTDSGMFTNHDPERGRTLYGAEVMIDPTLQNLGIGSKLYKFRRKLVERLELRRIRAASRLRGYHRFAEKMTAEEYAIQVIHGKIKDPTLSFQLKHGFEVVAIVGGYLRYDRESLGHAAIIEWINERVATPADYAARDPKFHR